MEHFVFKSTVVIPECYMEDVYNLRNFIITEMNIQISLKDTYLLWSAVSEDWDAGWLSITAHYEDQTRGEFLRDCMERHGRIFEG